MDETTRLEEMLRDAEDQLAGVPLTERTRDLLAQITECKRTISRWADAPPTDAQRSATAARATALSSEAGVAAERSKGPRSQKIRIV